MIMEYLGRSLESHFKKLNYNFSLKTVTLIGEQMIDRIKYIYSQRYKAGKFYNGNK